MVPRPRRCRRCNVRCICFHFASCESPFSLSTEWLAMIVLSFVGDLPFADFALIFGDFCGACHCPVWVLFLCLACTENYCSASSVISSAFCCMLSCQVGAFTAIALLEVDALPAC
ncbi:hypothetical protein Pelo_7829 [Pelomyxa schiedti]|nr:hypothetical protein Pelo_7829 [Pelomyxa schiedti]